MVTYQWNIFWVDLDPTKGSEQAGKRPVLVISADDVNQALPVITVLPLTTAKPGRHVYPIEVFLGKTDTGLLQDSIAMAHQIRAISKKRLRKQCGTITSPGLRHKVRVAVRLYLDM